MAIKTLYETSDGYIFDDQDEAITHNDYIEYLSRLDEDDVMGKEFNVHQRKVIATWISENFTFTPDETN